MNNTDRIQINGIWYIPEQTTEHAPIVKTVNTDSITFSEQAIYEDEKYSWEVCKVIYKHEPLTYCEPYIHFRNKNTKEEEAWDNFDWVKAVVNNESKQTNEALELMDREGIILFRTFIKHLIAINWLTWEK